MRDLEDLLEMGARLEARPELMAKYAEGLLRVRDREGVERPLKANAVQLAFERGAWAAEYCAEGSADGDYDVGGGTIFFEDGDEAWGADAAGGADEGGRGGDLSDGAAVLGVSAEGIAGGAAAAEHR